MKRLHSEPPQPFDAGVVLVWGDRLVNLLITDHQGYTHRRTSVDLLQEGDAVPETGGYATWMPYQAKAAKKDEVAPAPLAYPIRTVRDEFLMTLVHGAAEKVALSGSSNNAELIADNILAVVNKLHPQAVLVNPHTGQTRDPRDVTSDPQGTLIVAPNAPLVSAQWDKLPPPQLIIGTQTYPDGTTATGATPLPTLSPAEQDLEAEIQGKGLTAPRVTPADLQSNIVHTEIVKHISPSGQVLRWAVLTTRNGFAVAGRPSASASSANDNAEIGERVAIENARQELWPLMGYELRTCLQVSP